MIASRGLVFSLTVMAVLLGKVNCKK